jgi:hypothetical protein
MTNPEEELEGDPLRHPAYLTLGLKTVDIILIGRHGAQV